MKYPTLDPDERRRRLSVPSGRIRLVLDTDAKNEIDDRFAIAWALRSPDRFCVEAVYAAPFSHDCLRSLFGGKSLEHAPGITYAEAPAAGMEQSYEEIVKLYQMMGMDPAGKVFRGAGEYLVDKGAPVDSPAVQDLIRRAMSSPEPLYVAAMGAITNIASAILLEPALVEKIVVVWLGGQPLYFDHGMEFNLMQDVAAAQVLFDSGVPLFYIPCMNVASLLSLSKDEVEARLMGKGELATYLGTEVLHSFQHPQGAILAASMFRRSYLMHREDQDEAYLNQFQSQYVAWSRVIWDVSTIAFLKNPNWVPSTLVPAPVLQKDLYWALTQPSRHLIRVANYCHRDLIFGDMLHCICEQL